MSRDRCERCPELRHCHPDGKSAGQGLFSVQPLTRPSGSLLTASWWTAIQTMSSLALGLLSQRLAARPSQVHASSASDVGLAEQVEPGGLCGLRLRQAVACWWRC